MTAKKKRVQKRWLKSVLHKSRENFRPDDNILHSSGQRLWVFSTELQITHLVPRI